MGRELRARVRHACLRHRAALRPGPLRLGLGPPGEQRRQRRRSRTHAPHHAVAQPRRDADVQEPSRQPGMGRGAPSGARVDRLPRHRVAHRPLPLGAGRRRHAAPGAGRRRPRRGPQVRREEVDLRDAARRPEGAPQGVRSEVDSARVGVRRGRARAQPRDEAPQAGADGHRDRRPPPGRAGQRRGPAAAQGRAGRLRGAAGGRAHRLRQHALHPAAGHEEPPHRGGARQVPPRPGQRLPAARHAAPDLDRQRRDARVRAPARRGHRVALQQRAGGVAGLHLLTGCEMRNASCERILLAARIRISHLSASSVAPRDTRAPHRRR